MTTDYARIRRSADRAINRSGQSGYIRRTTPGTGPAWNPGEGSYINYPIRFVLIDYDQKDRDGTLILEKDQQALISVGSLSIEILGTDQLVDSSGNVYGIIDIKPLSPGGIVLLYTAQVRR